MFSFFIKSLLIGRFITIYSNLALVSVSNTINGDATIISDDYNALCSFTLPAGTHIIKVLVTFLANDTGFRRVGISADGQRFNINRFAVKCEQSVREFETNIHLSFIHVANRESPLYLMVQQNSGIELNCIYGIRVLTIENANWRTIPYDFLNANN